MTGSVSNPATRSRSLCAGIALALILVLPCAFARAQSQAEAADRAAARRLASDGFAALDRGQAAEAEANFTRALALYRAPTLYLARGRARLKLSWLVAAGEDFRAAINLPAAEGEGDAYGQARGDAAKELLALEPRFPTLTVQLSGAVPQQLKVNGTAWPLEAAGIARPLDPGDYKVEAIDPQGLLHTATVRLEEGTPSVVALNLLDPGTPVPGVAPAAAPAAASVPGPAQATTDATHEPSSVSTAAWVSAGITLALVVGAVVTGVVAANDRADYNDNNRPDVAHATKEKLRSSASTMGWVNTAFVGGALVGAGVTTYLWLSPPSAEAQALGPSPRRLGLMANVRLRY